MIETKAIRVPIGDGAGPYLTVHFSRTVLVVARTLTTTVWLLEFLDDVFADDPRVQVLFTVEDDRPSVYHQGARALLGQIGAAVVPWAQACATRFDLAICSTHTGSLEQLRAPLFITPHGPGFGKPASIRPGGQVPRASDERGHLLETTVVLSHPDQAALFEPLQHGVHLLVAGDPALDRLRASTHARPRLRRAFGVTATQRLIVLASTWGPGAQLGELPDLAIRLRAELGADDAQIAMIIHPNIWFGHGPWQVRAWLRTARDAGVILVPPEADAWRSAIVAADIAVVDHGSVGFYAAAIARPVIGAAFGAGYLIEDSPLAALGRAMPHLDLASALGPQIWAAIDAHDPARYDDIVAAMFAPGGDAVGVMRNAIYHQLNLAPPARRPIARAVSDPTIDLAPVTSHVVSGTVGWEADRAVVTIERRAAILDEALAQETTRELTHRLARGGGGETPRRRRG